MHRATLLALLAALMLACGGGDEGDGEGSGPDAVEAAGGSDAAEQAHFDALRKQQEALHARFAEAVKAEGYGEALALAAEAAKVAAKPMDGGWAHLLTLPGKGDALIAELQPRLAPHGAAIYRIDRGYRRGDTLVVVPTTDPWEAVLAIGTHTNGVEIDGRELSTGRLVQWLKDLHGRQPFALTGIAGDTIEGRFTAALADPAALAKEIYRYCPDVVDQGTDTVEALAAELRKSKTLFLWWD